MIEKKRRVVVTGMGVISPIGKSINEFEKSLSDMVIGIDKISSFDASKLPVQIAAEVRDFKPEEYIEKKLVKRLDRYSQFALAAAKQAVEMSGLNFEDIEERVGVLVSSGMGGFITLAEQNEVLREKGPDRVSPSLIPMILINMASGVIAMEFGLKGPNFAPVSACATSIHSIALGAMLIRHGYADVIIAGGSEATIAELPIAGFASMRALSTRNDEPKKASRPFDKDRDGFVLGEGAGAVVLEELEHAKRRGATILAEVTGSGMTADAYHITAPHPEGLSVMHVMRLALKDSMMNKEDIGYINVHGTSTPLGDIAETKAIVGVFGEHAYNLNISSTKSMTGHLLGAAGAVELIAGLLGMLGNYIPPTINHFTDDPDIDPKLNLTFNTLQERKFDAFMSNTFGFGGHNSSIVVKKYKE